MDYLARAALLGHDVEELQSGKTIRSVLTVDSIDEFKELFASDLSQEQRDAYAKQAAEFQNIPGASEFDGAMWNLIFYVMGDSPLTPEAAEHATRVFPVRVTAVSAPNYVVDSAETFGTDTGPCFINAGTLTFNNGSITGTGVIVKVVADTLEIQSATGVPYLISILGETGADGGPGLPGAAKPQAPNGADSSGGSPGVCTGASDGQPGTNGDVGNPGAQGSPGSPGIASMPGFIIIRAYDGTATNQPFTVYAQSGTGGNGGPGGVGGAGQQGGNGGNGCANACEGTDGGNGGNGGNGGVGGSGGNGGNGTNGAAVAITFPNAAKVYLTPAAVVAPSGNGGTGAFGGVQGLGGAGGGSGKHHSDGAPGNVGQPGAPGGAGNAGTTAGAEVTFNITYC